MNSNLNYKSVGCLICKSKDYSVVFDYDEPDQYENIAGIKKEGYFRRWVKCKKCGFYYSLYSREKGVLNEIYKQSYRDNKSDWRKKSPEDVFKTITALPFEESESKIRVKWIKDSIKSIFESGLVEKSNPPFNLLDIGGGNGIFAFEFKKDDNNWISHIIDPDINSKFVESDLKIPVIREYYKSGLFNKKFNLISLIYILEHLESPISFLNDVKKDMNSNSIIYIEIPDEINFVHKDKSDDIFNSCHLWMFSEHSLINFLNEIGFQVFCLNRLKTKRGHYALTVLASKKIVNI